MTHKDKSKQISIRITPEQQHTLRLCCAFKNITLSDYVLGAIHEQIRRDAEVGALEVPKFF